jgi:hypothetical protein
MLPLTPRQWVICAIAAIGFAFDIYEILMLPLIARPALVELTGALPGTPAFNYWVGMLFWVPAMAGGVFGLIGGYLADLFGRRRILVWSILLYAGSAFAAGYATSIGWLLFFRCTTFIGVCVEFVAAVAWLAELFPDPKRRETVLGYTQAFSSVGGILVTAAYFLSVTYAESLPALPLILVRPFLPESPVWRERKAAGTLARPSLVAIFAPQYRRTTIVTALMFACSYGAAFGAIQHTPRIVPGLAEVRVLPRPQQEQTVSAVQTYQEVGGLAGRLALAFLAVRIVSRRRLLRTFQVPGLLIIPLVFLFPANYSLEWIKWGIFAAGFFTVAQFSFWGNYLPRMYPVHLRGTGEGFAANVGGRMVGTSAALLTTTLANHTPGGSASQKLAFAAAIVAALTYGVGYLASYWLPEPEGEALPEDDRLRSAATSRGSGRQAN